jgi:hypothetical protein
VTAEKVGKIPNVTYLAMRKINLCKDDRKTVGESALGTRHKKEAF